MGDELGSEPTHNSQEKIDSASEPPVLATDDQVQHVPPQVPPTLYSPQVANPFVELFNWINGATSRTKAYGAPRVFDLFTLLAITLAFALLFALLGLLAPALDANASDLTLIISGFVTLIGIAQMWLFGSNNPRLASLVAGPFALPIAVGVSSLGSENWPVTMLTTLCFAIVFGSFVGYLGGGVVAGVFLLADQFRSRYMRNQSDQRDATFDELN